MPIRAVVFDIGGVLERVGDFEAALRAAWRERLGMSPEEFRAALDSIDLGNLAETGQMSEAEWVGRCAASLRLRPDQLPEFSADVWDWYCGELDEELMAFAASLRPRAAPAPARGPTASRAPAHAPGPGPGPGPSPSPSPSPSP